MDQVQQHRPGWLRHTLLVGLVVCGGLGGLYLASGPVAAPPRSRPAGEESPGVTHRFPLATHDTADTQEAPALAVGPDRRVFLTWASKTAPAERSVFITHSADGGRTFAAPQSVSKGPVLKSRGRGKGDGFERRALPHVAVVREAVCLAWTGADPGGTRLQLLLAESADGGRTFAAPRPVHRAPEANATFTALAVGPGGDVACSWLGGPSGQQQVYAAIRRAGSADFDAEQLVYGGPDGNGVCPCCPTAACVGTDGTIYVAFRNNDGGYRDIAVSVVRPGETSFAGPFPVTPPTWRFDGCPHDGPSLAVADGSLHVVWMDARSGSPRCYHATAAPGDMKFTACELHPISAGSQGNARLCVGPDGRLHAVWEESAGESTAEGHGRGAADVARGSAGRAVYHAVLGDDGVFGGVRAVAPRAGAFQTRPAVAVAPGGRVFVAWNELDEGGKSVVVHSFDSGATP